MPERRRRFPSTSPPCGRSNMNESRDSQSSEIEYGHHRETERTADVYALNGRSKLDTRIASPPTSWPVKSGNVEFNKHIADGRRSSIPEQPSNNIFRPWEAPRSTKNYPGHDTYIPSYGTPQLGSSSRHAIAPRRDCFPEPKAKDDLEPRNKRDNASGVLSSDTHGLSKRASACLECQKAKRRCIHDKDGNVDLARATKSPLPRPRPKKPSSEGELSDRKSSGNTAGAGISLSEVPTGTVAPQPRTTPAPSLPIHDRTKLPTGPSEASLPHSGLDFSRVPKGPKQRSATRPTITAMQPALVRSTRQPYVFIPRDSIPVSLSTTQHLLNRTRLFQRVGVQVDAEGYYIVFRDHALGKDEARSCYNGLNGHKMWNHTMEMQLVLERAPVEGNSSAERKENADLETRRSSSTATDNALAAVRDTISELDASMKPSFLGVAKSPLFPSTAKERPSTPRTDTSAKDQRAPPPPSATLIAQSLTTPESRLHAPIPSNSNTLRLQLNDDDVISEVSSATSSMKNSQCHVCKKAFAPDFNP
ncbi:hypothetical protein BJ546DRAFT_640704 [Cryomyces antarcticus]